MNLSIAISRKLSLAYSNACKTLCKESKIPQTAFDILMFLGNNPDYKTASEITEIRHIKANLVSMHVERLVQDGYLIRQSVNGDRRKTNLLCTEKAELIIIKGRKLQNTFSERLFANMDTDTRKAFFYAINIIEENLNEILKEE